MMIESDSIFTPLVSSCIFCNIDYPPFSDRTLYRSMVGSLQYATVTGPNIRYPVNNVCCQILSHTLESNLVEFSAIPRVPPPMVFICVLPLPPFLLPSLPCLMQTGLLSLMTLHPPLVLSTAA